MQNDLNIFLESFQHTGIYIIDRVSMVVYYENSVAAKYTAKDRIGEPCYLVHENQNMCASCPLRHKDWTSYVIREDLDMVFVMQATETMWQGKEVYAIFVRRQKNIPKKSMSEGMTRRMNRALNTSVLTYCEINMKTLKAKALHFSDKDTNRIIEGNYADHLQRMTDYYVHPKDRERVHNTLGLLALQKVSADSEGVSEISVRYRSSGVGAEGHSIMIESTAYILRDELPHYVSIITKEVTQEADMSMELKLYNEVARKTLSIYRMNITQNTCESIGDTRSLIQISANEPKHYDSMEAFFAYVTMHVSAEQRQDAKEFLNRDGLIQSYREGKQVLSGQFSISIADGSYIWLLISINMIENTITGDIEAILHSEGIEESVKKDNLITQVINNDYDYMILIDLQNNSASAFTNAGLYHDVKTDDAIGYIEEYIRRSYVGENLEEFVVQNSYEYIQKKLEQQDQYILYYYVREKNGSVRYKRGTYTYLNGDRRYLVFSRTDNTDVIEEQKKINEQLKSALEAATKATEAKTEIFSRMSHDLRTPMNGIVGMAKLGMDEAKDSESRHYFEKINSSGQYLLGLINDILDMNRLENDKVTLHEEAVNGKEFLQGVMDLIQPLVEQRNIRLETDFTKMENAYIFCDIVRTRQVFLNFLSNAVKFSAPGGKVKWTCRDLKQENGHIFYEMKFIDHGCGMSQGFLKRAFEPFEQESNIYSNENASTGLGLAITKNLVQIMGGKISVVSKLHEGTTFTLNLNHKIARECDVNENKEADTDFSLEGKKVLVVEDHPLNAEIEKRLLEKQGIIIQTAENGKVGLDIFEKSELYEYDAILMDVRMPVMGGLEAASRIRNLERTDAQTIPIIAVTANAFEEDRKASEKAGMNAHLSKPLEPVVLYRTLQQFIKK
ncbi:MAG: response regulator [Lachnospiraceae bacterium]|nr:response regulator [Lachnospiraceae bacterium]MDD3615812.1 response regulator [Lachnospiraceae bacterium]